MPPQVPHGPHDPGLIENAPDSEPARAENPERPAYYRIRVRGNLGAEWSAWFEGLEIEHESDGSTALRGSFQDDAALFGAISKVRDLGLALLSVEQREPKRNAD